MCRPQTLIICSHPLIYFVQVLIFISSVIFIVETLEDVKKDRDMLDLMHVSSALYCTR